MINSSIKKRTYLKVSSLTSGIFLSLCLISIPAFGEDCKNLGKHLSGSIEVLQGQGGGGMWGLMQQTEGYQSKAMVGMQIDSKLQRSVSIYGTKCEDGENPGKGLAETITAFVDRAREIKNQARRGLPDQIIPKLDALNSDLSKHLEN